MEVRREANHRAPTNKKEPYWLFNDQLHPTSLGVPELPLMLPPHLYTAKQDFGLRWWDFIRKTYCGNSAPWDFFSLASFPHLVS